MMKSTPGILLPILLVSLMSIAKNISAQDIYPYPVSMARLAGSLEFGSMQFAQAGFSKPAIAFMQDYFSKKLLLEDGLTLKPGLKPGVAGLRLNKTATGRNKESYHLKVDHHGVLIEAGNEQGLFYGLQTFVQLIPSQPGNKKFSIPYVDIQDSASFDYRGMHLDVCRHFFPLPVLKRYIDYLAMFKFNVFHWHLTDDQGWRIEIKKYPLLTKIGSHRNGTIIGHYPGQANDNTGVDGFYTQAEVKELIAYAAQRYIQVIPEIEMPGHSSAAIAAYPFLSCFPGKPTIIPRGMASTGSISEQAAGRIKLVQETWGVFDDVYCAGKDSTFAFLDDVLDEVIGLFPSAYIHIGGDECPKTNWKACPKCQQRMKDLGLKTEEELQSYFVKRIADHIQAKGRSVIGWDEILEGGLAPGAAVMSWRGEKGGIEAAKMGHHVVMTPGSPLYFDHSQSRKDDSLTIGGYNPLEKVYAYSPVPDALDSSEKGFILGAQGNVWTEYITNEDKVMYMVLPRMAALAESVWSGEAVKNWERFKNGLPVLFKRFEIRNTHYSVEIFEK